MDGPPVAPRRTALRLRGRPWRLAGAAARAFAALGVLALAALVTARLLRVAAGETGFPLWDEAAHGLAGLDLADALRAGDPLGMLRALNDRVTWPFLHSILLLPGFLLLGNGYATGDVVSAVLLGAAAVTTYTAGLALHPTRGAWLGAAAAVLLLLAPAYRLYGTLTMLEVPGALLLAAALACYARAGPAGSPAAEEDAPRSRGALRAAAVASAALMLTKYNYGLLWLVPLAAHEATGTSAEGCRRLLDAAADWWRGRSWLRPFPLFVAAYLLFLAAIVATGGWDIVVAGHPVSIHSPGNPAYLLYVILLVRWAARRTLRPAASRAAWRALPARARTLLAWGGLPLAAWFAVPLPNRVDALVSFVRNRADAAPLGFLERLAFYPRAFLTDYAPGAVAGVVILALALLPPRRTRPGDPARLVYLAMWVGLAAATLHGYHQPRFLFTAALLVWLSAARTAIAMARALARVLAQRRGVPPLLRRAAWGGALAALLTWGALGGPSEAWLRAAHRGAQSPPALGPLLDWIADETARSHGGAVLLGQNVRVSPALVAWRLRLASPALRREAPARRPGPPAGGDSAAIGAHARALAAGYERVLAILPVPGGPLVDAPLLAETRGDSLVVERLLSLPGIEVRARQAFPDAGFRALELGRHTPAGTP